MNRRFSIPCLHLACICALLIVGCGKPGAESSAGAPASGADAAESKGESRSIKLNPEDVAKMGIALSAAVAAQYAPETEGFGVVLSHEPIAQAVSDAAAARAAVRQSAAALARSRRLAGTAGADSAESLEAVQRQAATDQSALQLAVRKLSAILGQRLPWPDADGSRILDDIAAGRRKVLRATFPLGAQTGGTPSSLRVARLDAAAAEQQWTARPVWTAPADLNIPGRSFFALLPDVDVGEGERLSVWAQSGGRSAGAWVPAAAQIISEGRYWVYVERSPGVYVRTALDVSHPLREGYLVERDIKPGDRIVSAGAGLLLAREMNQGRAAD